MNKLAYEFRHHRRQIHKQQYRQTHTQHHRYRRDDRTELVPKLIVQPLFKLGLLLLIVLRHLLLSRPCKALVAVYKRSKEAENAPHKRRFPVPRRIFSAFYRPLLQVYGAVRQAASHSRLVDATHHNALDNSLSTDL